jgi:hypothetical protein
MYCSRYEKHFGIDPKVLLTQDPVSAAGNTATNLIDIPFA